MSIPFVKMHGLGNDYIYVDAFSRPDFAARKDLPALARAMSHRHTGIGADGLILVCRPPDPLSADVRMRMFNADGSESQMCGNGIRCVAKFAHDRLGIRPAPPAAMRIHTLRGILSITYTAASDRLTSATVNMGEPILDLAAIPVDAAQLTTLSAYPPRTKPHEHPLSVLGRELVCTFVSMGNPHAVFFNQSLDLAVLGPAIENHLAFPQRINAHAVQVSTPTAATMHTWERGSGLTQACGTGACAVLVAGVLTGRLARAATLTLPGGTLAIRWDEPTNHVFMTGPATEVFEGTWPE
ncbi:MAG: diaminopimelate epimerase [Phycisphaerales bacterium]